MILTTTVQSAYTSALLNRLPEIEAWVYAGGVFVVNDGARTIESSPLIFGLPDAQKHTGGIANDLVALPPRNTLVTDGPFGKIVQIDRMVMTKIISGGYVAPWTLPPDVVPIFVGQRPEFIAAFSYRFGEGAMYYTTMDVNDELDNDSHSTSFFPNHLRPECAGVRRLAEARFQRRLVLVRRFHDGEYSTFANEYPSDRGKFV